MKYFEVGNKAFRGFSATQKYRDEFLPLDTVINEITLGSFSHATMTDSPLTRFGLPDRSVFSLI